MRRIREVVIGLYTCVCLGGCAARFTDERPPGERGADLALAQSDGQVLDLLDVGGDGGAVADLAVTPGAIAEGTFMGRAGHGGKGRAELYRRSDGVLELRFGADFQVTGVVGPFVYLTSRADMGATVDVNADVELGALTASAGAQSYVVPAGADAGRRNVFVWCKPFKVEIAKAALGDLP